MAMQSLRPNIARLTGGTAIGAASPAAGSPASAAADAAAPNPPPAALGRPAAHGNRLLTVCRGEEGCRWPAPAPCSLGLSPGFVQKERLGLAAASAGLGKRERGGQHAQPCGCPACM